MTEVVSRPNAAAPSFGALLAALRRRAGLSQMALALETGVSPRHLSFLESGRSGPSAAMIERLAQRLRPSPAELERLRMAAGFAPSGAADGARLGLSPSERLALDAFGAALEIDGAPSQERAVETAGRFLERIGIRHFATGVVRRPAEGPIEVEMDRGGRPAVGWLQHFRRRNYRHRDALVARTASGFGAFFWSDLDRGGLQDASRRILDEARDFRIHDGFVAAIPHADGTIRAFTSWAERLDAADPVTRTAARLVATALIDVQDRFAREPLAPGLPGPQRALLAGVRHGRCLETLGERLGLDPAGVREALQRACLDMGVETPAEAADRAAALGLLGA